MSVERWLEARKLRNRLVYEYMESPDSFAEDLTLAHEYTGLLIDAFNRIHAFALTRMGLSESDLPPVLPAKSIDH